MLAHADVMQIVLKFPSTTNWIFSGLVEGPRMDIKPTVKYNALVKLFCYRM